MRRPPILICGCHGGGTSYATRLLRYQGFFAGADACELTERKWHESRALSRLNEWILGELVPGACGSPESRSFAMRTVRQDDWNTYLAAVANEERIEEIARTLPLREIFERYLGKPLSEELGEFSDLDFPQEPWGWKDPRNSLTLPVWRRIFSNARVLVIQKPWQPGGTGHSKAGRWFKQESTPFVRDLYLHPPALDRARDDHFFLQLPEGISEHTHFNAVLRWMGLPELSTNAHEALLRKTRVEWGELLGPAAAVSSSSAS